MKYVILTATALLVAGCATDGDAGASAAAASNGQETGGVIERDMTQLACLEVVDALNAQSEILGGAPERGLISNDQAMNLATNIGQRLARDAGNSDLATGLGIAGRIAGQAMRSQESQDAAEREAATRRWYYLSGIYDGRDCDALIAAEMQAL